MRQLAVVIASVLLVPANATASRPSWRWPVRGDVVVRFSASDAAPFAAGRHRGIAIAAAPGARVESACDGYVAFASAVGRAGPTVSVRCGSLRATYQGLGAIAVRRGVQLAAGARIGSLDERGVLRLGARRDPRQGGLHRYVDPLALLRGSPPDRVPPCGACLGRAPRAATPRPRAVRSSRAAERVPAPERGLSVAVWVGVTALALAAPSGALVRRRRARAVALAQPVRR